MMTLQNVSKIAVRLVAAAIVVALIYRSGSLSTATLWWLCTGVVVLIGCMLLVGRINERSEDRRLLDVRRGLDCLLAALAWVLLAAPWIRLQFGEDTYAGAAVTFLPPLPLVLVGAFLLIRTLSSGPFSSHR